MRGLILFLTIGMASQAQTFTTLASFDGTNGENPGNESLVEGLDAGLYGTTRNGGAYRRGTVFVMTAGGQLNTVTSVYTGKGPDGSLAMTSAGGFYGTTAYGGAAQCGSIFKTTAGGRHTDLYTFNCMDGSQPFAGLTQAFDGRFYGTTNSGGTYGEGTVYRITSAGMLTILHDFPGFKAAQDGAYPMGEILQAASGLLYGATEEGGAEGFGTVFSMAANGKVTVVYNFHNDDGRSPWAPVEGRDGKLYGVTNEGGAKTLGTVYQLTPDGVLDTLVTFAGSNGSRPFGQLALGTDGNFYGTTSQGGDHNAGTIFQVTPSGGFTVLHSFSGSDGASPLGGLVQRTDGSFYGTTDTGGARSKGTVFRLSMGLGPFVRSVPWFGAAGAKVAIIGTDLTGATSVTFNGTAAVFTVVSPTEIQTTVPAGASTGVLQVVTPGGTLAGNVAFQVL
ncbi:MAG TPA: choice-of-anchor tandem repeat GloVer-containing protein [Bryobacteraceae bacterium]|nr:choice-of-anchor tandem repeat GloVer-containing protein [Bryobacteraceae bacterium]